MRYSSHRQGIGTLVFILVGPIIWAVHLTLVYGSQSSLCAFNLVEDRSGGTDAIVYIILAATALFIAAAGFGAVRASFVYTLIAGTDPPLEQIGFIIATMRILAGLSILAMLYVGLSAVILPACDQLR